MTLLLDIPDDITSALSTEGGDPSRSALEAIALEGYRSRRLSSYQIQRMLGLETSLQVHAFLKEHKTPLNYDIEEFEKDLAIIAKANEMLSV